MIRETIAAYEETGILYGIENVVGASSEMTGAKCLRGSMFGLHVDRPRYWKTNFELHLDQALLNGGRELRKGTCTGFRRRWRRRPW